MSRSRPRAAFALTIAFSLAAVALSVAVTVKSLPPLAWAGSADLTDAGRPAATDAGSAGTGGTDAGSALALDFIFDAGAQAAEPDPVPAVDVPAGGFHLADGTPVAPLGKGAPHHVRFGVVLVTYEGAEGAPDKGARHKADGLALATKLAADAKGDFGGAVQHGDTGSSADVGQVTRGVLEPGSEAVLFALPVGAVSDVIDTPRGFWIVKRLE
jgi:hypothetical protein